MAKSKEEAVMIVKRHNFTGPIMGRTIKRCRVVGKRTYEETRKFLDRINSHSKIWNEKGEIVIETEKDKKKKK